MLTQTQLVLGCGACGEEATPEAATADTIPAASDVELVAEAVLAATEPGPTADEVELSAAEKEA